MKSYDLQPTQLNIKETFFKNVIDRNRDVVQFCSLLDSIEGYYSIALDGKWGSGKTFFVRQVKMLLEAYNDSICNPIKATEAAEIKEIAIAHNPIRNKTFGLQPQVAVYYDAWSNDNDEDPILSLIYSIIKSTDTNYNVSNNRDLLKITGSIADFFTGKNISSFFEAIKGSDPLESMRKEQEIHDTMVEFFDVLLVEHGNRLVIIIDELDRCKPSYAVRILERIKHYFYDDRITFVFSINTEQLQHTIKRYYGNEFAASRYLDRFFNMRIQLPPANLKKYFQSIVFENSRYLYDQMCHLVMKTYHFELREIAKYVQLVKIAAYEATHNSTQYNFSFSEGEALHYALVYIVPIMIGLKIFDENAYSNFVSGKDGTPLIEIFRSTDSGPFNTDLFRIDSLLNINETYNNKEAERGGKLVSPENKIKEIYHALFIQDYSGKIWNKNIGKLQFDGGIKDTIMHTASFLSEFTDYAK